MLRDPVCGMLIQEAEAYAVRHLGDAHVALETNADGHAALGV
jgi:hypothetical protein